MQTEIQVLRVIYKGELLKLNKDYTLHGKTKEVIFKTFINKRYLKLYWETVPNAQKQ